MANSKDSDMETDPKVVKELQLNKSDTDLLKELLQRRLNDCGWRQSIRTLVHQTIDERGVQNITYEELAAEIIPQAHAMVPKAVRKELNRRIMRCLDTEGDLVEEY